MINSNPTKNIKPLIIKVAKVLNRRYPTVCESFIGTYILNKRTPKPEGCEDIGSECEGCQITSCSHYKEKEEKKKVNILKL